MMSSMLSDDHLGVPHVSDFACSCRCQHCVVHSRAAPAPVPTYVSRMRVCSAEAGAAHIAAQVRCKHAPCPAAGLAWSADLAA